MTSLLMKAPRCTKNLCKGMYNTVKANCDVLKPKYLWFEVTDKCNSRCEYCNIHLKTPMKDPLSPEETKQILSNPLFSDVCYIINSGGEPSVRSDLLEILLAQHEALPHATIQLSTNGLLPDRVLSVVKELLSRNVDVEVGISLDGVGDEHDRIRGVKGNFAKVDYLVKELQRMKAKVAVGATLTNKNLANNLEAKEYARALQVPFMYHWFNTSGFYGNEKSDRQETYRETAGMIHEIQTTSSGLYSDMWINELKGMQPKFKCFALNTFAVLKCNGDIVPCLSMWNNTIGNIRDTNPTSVWRSQEARDMRKTIRQCKGCLNSWGAGWSLATSYYPNLIHKVKEMLFSPKMQFEEVKL